MQPFLPDKAAQLLDTLGVAQDKRTFGHAIPRCDLNYGVPTVDPGSGRADGLFPPLIEDMDVEFAGSSKSRQKAKKSKHPDAQTEN
jgi:methionyl-tRNA synthetase